MLYIRVTQILIRDEIRQANRRHISIGKVYIYLLILYYILCIIKSRFAFVSCLPKYGRLANGLGK